MTSVSVRRLTRFVTVAGCFATLTGGQTAAQERSTFDDVRLEVTPETSGGAQPYPNEMVLLRIRGLYRPLINIAHVVQPSLVDFNWTNLTRDVIFASEWGGFPARAFERTIAVFPEKTGDLVIGSFTHKLTVVDGLGQRLIEVKSPPVTLKVADWQGPGGPRDPNRWWLPSSGVRVTDQWSGDPNHMARGETIRRTVTIEADGAMAEQLPPAPVMRSGGVISFRGPIDRDTRITEAGPVARAVYRWDMRPTTAFPAIVEPVKIPWFDTTSRTLREAVVPAQRMAWTATDAPGAKAETDVDLPSTVAVAGAGLAAFLVGFAVLTLGAGGRSGLPRFPPRALFALRLAAWRKDAPGARAAVTRLAHAEPDNARVWSRDADVRGALADLDRRLFDASAGASPDLRRLARLVSRARGEAITAAAPRQSALAPLDGPAPKL